MAPLEDSWFARRMEGVTIYVVDEIMEVTEREKGNLSSSCLSTLQPTHPAVSPVPPHNPPPNAPPPTAKPVPKSPEPAQTQATTFSSPMNPPPASPAPTSAVTNTAVGDQITDPTPTPPPARIQSGDVGNAKGKSTTVEVSTTIVTSGVFTTHLTTVLPNGQTTVIRSTSTGIHTITTTTAVPTQIGTVSSTWSGPPAGIIGGIIGAVAVMVLALIAFCILRRKRRRLNKLPHVASNAGPSTLTVGAISEVSTVPRPFFGTSSPEQQPTSRRGKVQLESPEREPRSNRAIGQNNIDPFQDPETVQGQEEPVMRARNALDRLQELTREAEEELRELGSRARCGQLSDSERGRLDEIRRATGLTIVYDPGLGRFSTTSSTSSYTTSPPSYHSDSN